MLIRPRRFADDAPEVRVPVFVMPPRRVRAPLLSSLATAPLVRVQKHRSGREGVLVNRPTKSIAT